MGSKPLQQNSEYKVWIVDLKSRLRAVQLKAAVSVNSALLEFYWELGADIVEKQKNSAWGSGFLQQLSQDLRAEFPDMKGFSKRNLERIRRWHLFYSGTDAIATQPVSQLSQIPWGHNIVIVSMSHQLPDEIQSSLPSIEQIEAELMNDG